MVVMVLFRSAERMLGTPAHIRYAASIEVCAVLQVVLIVLGHM
jgi:hypothetical protein